MIPSYYQPSELAAVKALITTAFTDSEGSEEGALIGQLAEDIATQTNQNDLYGFVTRQDSHVIAAIFFSRLTFQHSINAFILSPVAVHPAFQRQGVGQKLIHYGLEKLSKDGVELAFTYGDPDYYKKVGFSAVSEDKIRAPLPLSFPHGWLVQSLTKQQIPAISGPCHCVSALDNPVYW